MNTATKMMNRFMGGIDVNSAERLIDKEVLDRLFPRGVPAYTVVGGVHFSFRPHGSSRILTCVRKVMPA